MIEGYVGVGPTTFWALLEGRKRHRIPSVRGTLAGNWERHPLCLYGVGK